MRGIAALEVNHDHQMPLSGMSGQASLFEKKRAVQRPEGQPPMSWFVHYSRSNGGEAANL